MDNKLEVEVMLKDNDVWYKAYVEDIELHGLEVSFERKWTPRRVVSFPYIRFPPENSSDGFKENQIVEVRSTDSERKISSWRRRILVKLNLDTGRWTVGSVDSDSYVTLFSKVKMSDIRHVNKNPAINKSAVQKVEIDIPKDLRKIAENADIHTEFRKQVHVDVCKFIPERNALRLIFKQNEFTRKAVDMLKGAHINFLKSELEGGARPVDKAKFVL